MVTLKQLHENFIDEQIRENYFLNTLFEAINAKQITRIADSIDKLENVANLLNNEAINTAMDEARKQAKLVATAGVEDQEKIITKLVEFYSKITNFFKTDLPALKRVNLKDFFDKTGKGTFGAKLLDEPDNEDIKKVLRRALTTDSFFGKILGRFGLTSQAVSAVPYLDIEKFIQNFMTTPKGKLLANINAVIKAVGGLEGDPSGEGGGGSGGGSGGGGGGSGGGSGGGGGGSGGGSGGGGGGSGGGGGGAVDAISIARSNFSEIIKNLGISIARKATKNDKADAISVLLANNDKYKEFILDQIFVKNTVYSQLANNVFNYLESEADYQNLINT